MSPTTPPPPPPAGTARAGRSRTLAELKSEQGIQRPQDFNALLGAGADLWADAADFEAFLATLRAIRREKD
jgi:hypothetical protein